LETTDPSVPPAHRRARRAGPCRKCARSCRRCRRRPAEIRPWRRRGPRGGPRPGRAVQARHPEAGREILVIAFGLAVLERHAHDFVAGRYGAVPRALQRDKQAALVFGRELVALVEDEIEQRGMRGEQEIGGDRRFDLVGREVGETGLRVLADIGVGPAVEPALLHADQIIGGQVVAEPVALLHQGPEISCVGVKGECRRVARARRDGRLIGAVGIEALDRRLGLGLDPEIARGADANIKRAALRVGSRTLLQCSAGRAGHHQAPPSAAENSRIRLHLRSACPSVGWEFNAAWALRLYANERA
jgi:hypothetical protein